MTAVFGTGLLDIGHCSERSSVLIRVRDGSGSSEESSIVRLRSRCFIHQAEPFSLITHTPKSLIGGAAALRFLVMRWHAGG